MHLVIFLLQVKSVEFELTLLRFHSSSLRTRKHANPQNTQSQNEHRHHYDCNNHSPSGFKHTKCTAHRDNRVSRWSIAFLWCFDDTVSANRETNDCSAISNCVDICLFCCSFNGWFRCWNAVFAIAATAAAAAATTTLGSCVATGSVVIALWNTNFDVADTACAWIVVVVKTRFVFRACRVNTLKMNTDVVCAFVSIVALCIRTATCRWRCVARTFFFVHVARLSAFSGHANAIDTRIVRWIVASREIRFVVILATASNTKLFCARIFVITFIVFAA